MSIFLIVTDNGNYIVDLFFEKPIADVALAAKELKSTGKNGNSTNVIA